MMENVKKNSLTTKNPRRKATFFLTSDERTFTEPSNELKETSEQDRAKGKFASVARTVLLANRAFPQTRKPTRVNSVLVHNQSETQSVKFATTAPAPANSVDDTMSAFYGERLLRENTYKMEPDDLFLSGKARVIIHNVLEEHLKSKMYTADDSKRWSVEISEEIKRKIKAEEPLERYKFVCVVWIGQQLGQGIHITSRCLWNAHFDNFARDTFRNDHLFAEASVFAVFVE